MDSVKEAAGRVMPAARRLLYWLVIVLAGVNAGLLTLTILALMVASLSLEPGQRDAPGWAILLPVAATAISGIVAILAAVVVRRWLYGQWRRRSNHLRDFDAPAQPLGVRHAAIRSNDYPGVLTDGSRGHASRVSPDDLAR